MNIEALLIASGQNVKRLLTFGGRSPKKLVQAAALRPPAATSHKISCAREHRSSRSWRPTKAFFNKLSRFGNKVKVFTLEEDKLPPLVILGHISYDKNMAHIRFCCTS